MSVKHTVCPACVGTMRELGAWLNRCESCGLFISSLPSGAGTGVDGLEVLRQRNYKAILDRLSSLMVLEGASLIEIGCAKGWFLAAAQARGVRVLGLEPQISNADIARAAGFDVLDGFFPEVVPDDALFDIIAFNDVFEHLPDPAAAICAVERHLAPGGLAVLKLPSSNGIVFKIARALDYFGIPTLHDRLWQRGMPSPHITYFSPRNLVALVSRHTSLELVTQASLATMTREGLSKRISATHRSLAGQLVLATAWIGASALPLLPADIALLIFRKPKS